MPSRAKPLPKLGEHGAKNATSPTSLHLPLTNSPTPRYHSKAPATRMTGWHGFCLLSVSQCLEGTRGFSSEQDNGFRRCSFRKYQEGRRSQECIHRGKRPKATSIYAPLRDIPADPGRQDLLARVKSLTAERNDSDKKREMAEYTYSKYADDLRVARSEASDLQRSMVGLDSTVDSKLTSLEDRDAFVMVLVDGDGMPVSSTFVIQRPLARVVFGARH